MKATEQTIRERKNHHAALVALAESLGRTGKTGLQLWRQLRRIENAARRAMEDYCNGTLSEAGADKACDQAESAVKRIFGGTLPPRFHVNRDPRGYALKLLSNDNGSEAATRFALHSDWGRNQILAPEID